MFRNSSLIDRSGLSSASSAAEMSLVLEPSLDPPSANASYSTGWLLFAAPLARRSAYFLGTKSAISASGTMAGISYKKAARHPRLRPREEATMEL